VVPLNGPGGEKSRAGRRLEDEKKIDIGGLRFSFFHVREKSGQLAVSGSPERKDRRALSSGEKRRIYILGLKKGGGEKLPEKGGG